MSQQHMLALWIILLFSRGSTASSNVSSPSPERAVITMPTGVADVRTPAPPLHSSTASSNVSSPSPERAVITMPTGVADVRTPAPPLHSSTASSNAFLPSNETATPTSDNTTTVPVTTNVTEVLTSVPPSHKDLRVISQFPFSIEAVPPGPMAEGKDYSLSCHIEIFIPNFVDFTVEWFIGQDRLNTETVNSTMEAINATHSFLYTPLITHNGAQYQCVVQFQPPGETSPLQHRSNALNIYVYSGCPVEISPPSLVVRYGDSASATCRALVPISGMGWESTVGAVGLEEGVTELNWTVKELREWTMRPQCFINPEDGGQCQKELPVIIYKTPDSMSVTANRHGPMAEGINYTLTCHIENIAPVQNLTVKWFKGDTLLNEDRGHHSSSVGPQNVTSDLPIVPYISDDGAQYKCMLELDLGPGRPPKQISDPFNITVYSGCPIDISPSTLVVRHGGSASADCSTVVPHNGMGWNSTLGPVRAEKRVKNVVWSVTNLTEWTLKSKCFIDTYDMQCEKELSVYVYYVSNVISITANTAGAMAEGRYYTLTCHIENIAPVQNLTVKWFKGGRLFKEDRGHHSSSLGPQNVTSDLRIVPDISDDGAQYKCMAELDLGPGGPPKQISDPFNITVYSGCPIVISPSTLVVRHGDSASADCSTIVPHNGMGWNSTLGPVRAEKGVQNVVWSVTNLTEWTLKSTCFIDTYDMQWEKELSVYVYYVSGVISITANTAEAMAEGKNYTLTCHIENIAPVQNLTVKWFKGDTLLNEDRGHHSSSVGPQNVTSDLRIVPDISDDGAQYKCMAELDLGPGGHPKQISDPFSITVYSSWTGSAALIMTLVILFLFALIFVILYIKRRRQGNYNVVQTSIPLN